MKSTHILAVAALLVSAPFTWSADAPKTAPKTKVEQFFTKHGTLTLRASTEVFESDLDDTDFGQAFYEVKTEVVELINPTSKTRAYGLRFKLRGRNDRESVSWLDEDELDSLIKGMEYLLNLKADVTKLNSVTGFYKTRDGMEIQAVKGEEEIFGIKARTGGFLVFEAESGFKKFRDSISAAQAKIADIKPE